MEASSSVLVEKSVYPKRNNSSIAGFNGGAGYNNFRLGYASQRLLNIHDAVGVVSLGPHHVPCAPYPRPAPTYSSLPAANIFQQPSPPLLPLPISKCLSLPSPIPPASSTRMVLVPGSAAHTANKDQKKPRPAAAHPKKDPPRGATRPQKVPPPAATPPARVPKPPAAASKDEKPEEEGDLADDVYALSPPPSSLPMPRFSLRARAPSAPPPTSCNAEAFGVGGALLAAADAGASDDLRRLLRL